MEIREGGLDTPQVQALLRLHLDAMHVYSPAESVHALDLNGLRQPDLSFWTIWEGDTLLGCGALRQLDAEHGEIKSMRTDPAHLRRGAAAMLLAHMIEVAEARGYRRLSLETGSGPAFEPALAMYRRFGFTESDAFADYPSGDPFSRFLSREV